MNKMLEQLQNSVLEEANRLDLPANGNYHDGLLLPDELELPDNILCFSHGFPSPEIQHNRYCIVIPLDPIKYKLNGTLLDLPPGTAVAQCPYAAHSIGPGQRGCRRVQISFDLTRMPEYFPGSNVTLTMSAAAYRHVVRILKLFRKRDSLGCALEIYRLCLELKGHVQNTLRAHKGHPIMTEVEQMTEFRQTRRKNIKSIADEMEMSESNLRLRFRRENGVSLGQFLQQNKLEFAQNRLENTRQTIGEIARLCGYDSQFSFSRFFKKQTGVSPLQWRKAHQAEPPQ